MYHSHPTRHQNQKTSILDRLFESIETIARDIAQVLEKSIEPTANLLTLLLQLAARFAFVALPFVLIDRHIGIDNWQLSSTGYTWLIAAFGVYLFGLGKFFRS